MGQGGVRCGTGQGTMYDEVRLAVGQGGVRCGTGRGTMWDRAGYDVR